MWYNLFSITPEGLDFKINPYGRCVKNKVIDGTQCTVAWYVDDNKLSHINPEVISDMINEVMNLFGNLSVVRGNNHNVVGMNLDINKSTIQINIVVQSEKRIKPFGEDVSTLVTYTATNKLL